MLHVDKQINFEKQEDVSRDVETKGILELLKS